MSSHGPLVFISYSRRDYYFAESLAFHLNRCGVQTWMDSKDLTPGMAWQAQLDQAVECCDVLVLVVSPEALASEHVTREWRLALAAGRRVVLLGWQRRVRLPPALQGCAWVDFRGRFAPALQHLRAVLATPASTAHEVRAGARPGHGLKLPPAVAGMLLALSLPMLGVGYDIAAHHVQRGIRFDFDTAMSALFCAASLWFLSLSLLQRRMGMTRLLGCLALMSLPFLWAAWDVSRRGEAAWANAMLGALPGVPLAAVLGVQGGLPLAAIAVLVWWRPEDLLRWAPTGKAWARYRVAAAQQARLPVPDPAQALAAVGRFHLLHDEADRPLAQQLRTQLQRLGASEATAEDTRATRIVLLSNHTTLDWIEREVQPWAKDALTGPPAGALLTVVGSAIRIDAALDWLWQCQWIDLRAWRLQRLDAERGLPRLPEAAEALRLPPAVARLHASLCVLSATSFIPVGSAQAEIAPESVGWDPKAWCMVSILLSGWAARQVARRGVSRLRLGWVITLAMGLGVALAVLTAWQAELATRTRAVLWLAVALMVGLSALAARAWPGAAFWLPERTALKPSTERRLAPQGDWRSLGTVLGAMLLWLLAVAVAAPELMSR